MSDQPMTRAAWVEIAAGVLNQVFGGTEEAFARETAETLADNQEGEPTEWPDPEEAANDELDAWD